MTDRTLKLVALAAGVAAVVAALTAAVVLTFSADPSHGRLENGGHFSWVVEK